jgi:tetratricopeptide (TPR) repeat protein
VNARYLSAAAAILIVLASSAFSAPATTSASAVRALIEQLADRDPAVRKQASDQLLKMGADARAEVLKASRSDDPEQRARAGEILLQMPWWQPSDPAGVRLALATYGTLNEEQRVAVIDGLAQDPSATDALLRLLREEPNDAVRWVIARALGRGEDETVMERVRKLDLSDDEDAPMLLLAGRAWLPRDRSRGLALLRRAIDADEKRPSGDASLIYFAFDRLLDEALRRDDFDAAAALLRRQVAREVGVGRSAIGRLAALHKYFGPLRGYEQDLRMGGSGESIGKARLSERVASFMRRAGVAIALPSDQMARRAHFGIQERMFGGYFLLQHDWPDAAECELRTALAAASREPAGDKLEVLASTHYLLSRVYAQRENDEAAAASLQQFMLLMTRGGLHMPGREEDDLWAEVFWRRAKAARQRGDGAKAVDALVADLMRYTPGTTDNAISIVNWLTDNGRISQARQLFERCYEQARSRIAISKNDPTTMNDTAWLCARCGMHLEDALTLINRALEARPDSSAYLDTAAEVHFRLGHRDKAVELESKAIQYDPDEQFMKKQLERFRTAPLTTQPYP